MTMIATDQATGIGAAARLHVVSHGKSGALGCFGADPALELPRGAMVVIETERGIEVGTVIGPAEGRSARLLGPAMAGRVLRPMASTDGDLLQQRCTLGQLIFTKARQLAEEIQLDLEILDVDMFFDGSQAIIQFVGVDENGLDDLASQLGRAFGLNVLFENLATPVAASEEHGGCGKPDCGQAGGGGCTSCGSAGGCSSCGDSHHVDMRGYFAHLRGQMEQRRTPLL